MAALLTAAGCATAPTGGRSSGPAAGPSPHYKIGKPYKINGRWYHPAEDRNYNRKGVASWYGDDFHGKPTANGEIFDMRQMTAAHTTLPLPSMVEVTNLDNGKRAVVRVNDRGPFAHNRIIDLSRQAARALGFEHKGLAKVRVKYLGLAPLPGERSTPQYAQAPPPTNPTPVKPQPVSPALKPQPAATTPADIAQLIEEADDGGDPLLPPPLEAEPAFIIRVATLTNLEDLPALRARLSEEGALRIARADIGGPDPQYRISLGPFASHPAAYERLEAVREAGYYDAEIVPVTP